MKSRSKTFESSMERLEQIVARLEQGESSLSESLKLFQEGTALVRACTAQLEEAELEIVKLTKGPDGVPGEEECKDDSLA